MAAENKSPVLVTGAHRTGTTWVGKMLAASSTLTYISEPLNILHRPGVMRAQTLHWYMYICEENEAEYLDALKETLSYRYHFWKEIGSLRSVKDILRMWRDLYFFASGRLFRRTPLIKDPFAVFSIPWFIKRFSCRVLVVVRHPAAFASSLLRLGWSFDFRHLLSQPLLMRDYLAPFHEEMIASVNRPDDIVEQAALLWRMIYQVVQIQTLRHPEISLVRHEDLSIDPVEGFREVYRTLGIPFTPRVERTIQQTSSRDNPTEIPQKRVHSIRLDSRANLDNWKRRLKQEDIRRIYDATHKVASYYYNEQSWQ